MKIWNIRSDVKNFTTIDFLDDKGDYLQFCPEWPDFEGQALGEEWSCPYRAKLREDQPVGNFVDFDPGILICDAYAMLKLRPYIIDEVEILPIDVDGLDLNILNITNLIDCLNDKQNFIKFFNNSKDVQEIKKYVFPKTFLKMSCFLKFLN